MNRLRASWIALLTLGAGGLAASTFPGCAFGNYPPIDEAKEDAAVNDPNLAPIPSMIRVALAHVIERWPVEGDYVVNLPRGMNGRRANEIMMKLGDPRAHLPAAEHESLPVYHVTRVWLRPGGTNEVEVLRPVFGVGAPGVDAEFQPISVRMRRTPLEEWEVDSVRAWPIGMQVPPPLYGWEGQGG
jgi:hypothetical protein